MTEVRQHNVAVRWTLTAAALVLPVLVLVLVVPQLPHGYSWQRWVVGLPCVLVFLYGGVQPLIWWLGADLVLDERGIRFGRSALRRSPGQVTFAARNPWFAEWSAVSDVRLVTGGAAVRQMRKAARAAGGPPQPTAFAGYFPARGRAALCFTVALDRVSVPALRPPSTRRKSVGEHGQALRASTTWAFPVRSVEPVLAALASHGLGAVETDEPPLPSLEGPAPLPAPDDLVVVRLLTENLGRAPTDEELADVRRKWYDTERYPHRPPD